MGNIFVETAERYRGVDEPNRLEIEQQFREVRGAEDDVLRQNLEQISRRIAKLRERDARRHQRIENSKPLAIVLGVILASGCLFFFGRIGYIMMAPERIPDELQDVPNTIVAFGAFYCITMAVASRVPAWQEHSRWGILMTTAVALWALALVIAIIAYVITTASLPYEYSFMPQEVILGLLFAAIFCPLAFIGYALPFEDSRIDRRELADLCYAQELLSSWLTARS